ncbi:aspartate/glutamate racemase family protein [Klebsiella sp. S69]|uniref:aspartate/glutamate racemase family protein n=1 Tax=Klebsiella sp. S69 TaxID=2767439 RepID=UPI001903CD6F|nr:amino acid racemase [Klebsiella sp. S69]MBK0166811.1 amino acid racemase [Klebsiella sp. S69]
MKKLGLIGGIGPESTLIYYKKLVYGAQQRTGEHFYPNLTIESLNVFDVLRFCQEKDYAGLTRYMMEGVNNLISAGAELIALTGNTPHIIFDELRARSAVPMISIVEAASEWATKEKISRAGLLGTAFTMQEEFFKKPFVQAGTAIVTPVESEMHYIAEKISSELEHGIVRPETQRSFQRIVNRMVEDEAIDAVILGCTELPLVFKKCNLSVRVLDTLEIHTQVLLREAFL